MFWRDIDDYQYLDESVSFSIVESGIGTPGFEAMCYLAAPDVSDWVCCKLQAGRNVISPGTDDLFSQKITISRQQTYLPHLIDFFWALIINIPDFLRVVYIHAEMNDKLCCIPR